MSEIIKTEFLMLYEHLAPLIIFVMREGLAESDIMERIIRHLSNLEKIILKDNWMENKINDAVYGKSVAANIDAVTA